jgi:paraquat-inducible protein B
MSESGPTNGGGDAPAEAIVEKKRRGVSAVWLIPIAVVIVAAGVAYQAIEARGVSVVVVFESGQGLVAGKSNVKYRDVIVGSVDLVEIRDPKHIAVHVTLGKAADAYMIEGAKWWVVRPRIGLGGVSGLGTLMSGSYVTFEPASKSGARKEEFVGLEDPPFSGEGLSGLRIILHSEGLAGLHPGAPVFFRDIRVGEVLHYTLGSDGNTVDIQALIQEEHAHLAKSTSRFWNAGGVEVSVGSGGLTMKTESLASILAGGVAFDSPAGGDPAKEGDAFWLATSYADSLKTRKTHGGLRVELEAGALGGVGVGNPVYYREVPVGAVVSHELSEDGSRVRVRVNIEPRYATMVRSNSIFWNAGGITAKLGLTGLKVHAESVKALLSGGIAFATPPKPGHTVKAGSVFQLHPEPKDEWIDWETDYEPKEGDDKEKHSALGRFFHHKGKSEEEAKQQDPTPEPSHEEKKHGVLHKLFGGAR